MSTNTRTRLVSTAARLFRQRGYHGVGLSEILVESQAPKGSLYHHFPNGKADLALAAAEWADRGMRQIIDESFAEASDFQDGATTLCFKLAKFFDISECRDGCPITSVLLDGQNNAAFHARATEILQGWVDAAAKHGNRLGLASEIAQQRAETLLLLIEGAWVMARARQSSDGLRRLPDMLPR